MNIVTMAIKYVLANPTPYGNCNLSRIVRTIPIDDNNHEHEQSNSVVTTNFSIFTILSFNVYLFDSIYSLEFAKGKFPFLFITRVNPLIHGAPKHEYVSLDIFFL